MEIITSTDKKKVTNAIHKMAEKLLGEKLVMALYIVQWNIASLVKRPVPMKYWMRVSTTLSVLEKQASEMKN